MKLIFILFATAVTLSLAGTRAAWIVSHKDNEFVIDKKKVETQFKDPAKLLSQATLKFIPGDRGNNLYVVITQLKKGSALELLGLQTGDTLQSVNDEGVKFSTFFDKKTPQAWLNKKRYVLVLERNGKTQTLIYNVQ
jgi:S1-C subfamily serine protease